MKFFRCPNDDCVANKPGTALEHKVSAELLMVFPVLEDGEIDYDADGRLGDITYTCGRCGDSIDELSGQDLMQARIQSAKQAKIYGQFKNSVRGDKIFHFFCDLKEGRAVSKEVDLWDLEAYFLLDYCREQYAENAIKVEIVDVVDKVYHVLLTNLDDGITISVEATISRILETNDRDLNPVEKERVLEAISEYPL